MDDTKTEIDNLKNRVTELEQKYKILSENFSTCLLKDNYELFFFLIADNEDLCYIMAPNSMLFIFKKKSLLRNPKFMKDYMFDTLSHHEKWRLICGILNRNCLLYREHIKSFDNDVLLCKYVNRHGLINKSVITEENGDLYVENQYLGTENYHSDNGIIYADQEKRKILDGITVEEYIRGKSQTDILTVLINMYDYLFKQYPSDDGNEDKVSGILMDLHTKNVIINNDGFHYIDRDVIYNGNLDKSLVLYRRFGNGAMYKELLKHYKLKDMSSQYSSYPLNNMNSEDMIKARKANEKIFKKYLTMYGLEEKTAFEMANIIIPEDIRSCIDAEWYAKQYPDFQQECGKDDAAYHYVTIGWKKGCNPSPDFDSNKYLEMYPDVVNSGACPLEHYVKHGKKEGRKVVPVKK